jgi:Serine/threonine protein phosphatase
LRSPLSVLCRKLAVSRAIGDLSLKPYVTSTPDTTDYMIGPDDLFLVIASDGIWVSLFDASNIESSSKHY